MVEVTKTPMVSMAASGRSMKTQKQVQLSSHLPKVIVKVSFHSFSKRIVLSAYL